MRLIGDAAADCLQAVFFGQQAAMLFQQQGVLCGEDTNNTQRHEELLLGLRTAAICLPA
ncbi:hypothetical protein ACFOGG_13555 [Brenneria rubrifaciens]|uniref:hypothetical protein n=1 Tax=Brenneria rubrifaciens TaxID=55213 RepID=UPI0036167BF4